MALTHVRRVARNGPESEDVFESISGVAAPALMLRRCWFWMMLRMNIPSSVHALGVAARMMKAGGVVKCPCGSHISFCAKIVAPDHVSRGCKTLDKLETRWQGHHGGAVSITGPEAATWRSYNMVSSVLPLCAFGRDGLQRSTTGALGDPGALTPPGLPGPLSFLAPRLAAALLGDADRLRQPRPRLQRV